MAAAFPDGSAQAHNVTRREEHSRFVVHLAVDGKGYAFSIKDSTDPCGFAFFSDQDGIIYSGEALR